MKKKLIIIGIVVVVIGGFSYVTMMQDSNSGTTVNASLVEHRDLEELVSASGRIQPATKVDITSEVNGEIISLLVNEGQRVETGQLLVVLDTVQLRSDVDQAKYSQEEIKARTAGSKNRLDKAKEDYERQDRLFKQNLSSDIEFKNAKYAYIDAQSAYDASQASAAQAKARYEKQLDYLSKAKIVAPMDGVVSYLDAEVGEIAAAQTAFTQGKTLMTISDLTVFEVEVEVDETEINKIGIGQSTDIEVDAFPDTSFAGQVVEIGNTALTSGLGTQDQTTNFRVKIVFQDTDVSIRPGMSATVDITTSKHDQVLAVPFSAVVIRSFDLDSLEAARMAEATTEESGATDLQAAEGDSSEVADSSIDKDIKREELKGVFVIRDGITRFTQVKTGIADHSHIEINDGLEPNDSVVTGPYRVLRTVKDGDLVNVKDKDEEGDN